MAHVGARPSVVRPAAPDDRDAVVAILRESVPARLREVVGDPLFAVLDGATVEDRCLTSRDREGGAITGFALFGMVAGIDRTGRVRAVAVAPLARRRGVGRALLNAALSEMAALGSRLVVAELPDVDEMRFFGELLLACGFAAEARVEHLVSDGVAMRYFVRRERHS